jgi:hypothetical protein
MSIEVDQYLEALEHPMKKEILQLRTLILDSNKELTELIKWNAPSFCIDGVDCILMKIFPAKNVQLVFHRGAKVKEAPEVQLIADPAGLLKWPATDRAVLTINDGADLRRKTRDLQTIVAAWTQALRKLV